MQLNSGGLILRGSLTSAGTMSLQSTSSSVGDIVSLYGDRLGHPAMYGFGVEASGGILYNKAKGGYSWYIHKNADLGVSAMMRLSSTELIVDGRISSEEVKVEVINGPDYVFEPDYELRSLSETKEYIIKNKHLPEIPSASEMENNGIDLGDMNMRLLKKIEELTLYQIELMEEMEKMKKELQRISAN